jgi:lysophospholipase L1-like esterase
MPRIPRLPFAAATLLALGISSLSAQPPAVGAAPGRGRGGAAAAPAPLPDLAALKSALTLSDEQAAQIGPLLAEVATALKSADDLRARYTTLRNALVENAGASLTDAQKTQLAQVVNPAPALAGAGAGAPAGRGAGGGDPAADQPASRTDQNSLTAHEQHLAKRTQGKIDVYFAGDSIARRWGTSDAAYAKYLANWKENFFGWNAADFAWGADTLQNILWRLDNGELDGVNPKVIVFLGGTNNVGGAPGNDAKAEEIVRGVKAVLGRFQQKAPNATVILTAIFPRNNNPQLYAFIKKINAGIAQLADGKKVRYLDVNDKLADANGNLFPGMMNSDNLHPDVGGYQVWADGLKPILTELLGPPAKEDHAPPPTGDPSATAPRAGGAAPTARSGG